MIYSKATWAAPNTWYGGKAGTRLQGRHVSNWLETSCIQGGSRYFYTLIS